VTCPEIDNLRNEERTSEIAFNNIDEGSFSIPCSFHWIWINSEDKYYPPKKSLTISVSE